MFNSQIQMTYIKKQKYDDALNVAGVNLQQLLADLTQDLYRINKKTNYSGMSKVSNSFSLDGESRSPR